VNAYNGNGRTPPATASNSVSEKSAVIFEHGVTQLRSDVGLAHDPFKPAWTIRRWCVPAREANWKRHTKRRG